MFIEITTADGVINFANNKGFSTNLKKIQSFNHKSS